jgi:hypothetical protein
VPYEVRALATEMVQYTKDVTNEGGEGVLLDPFQLVGGAEAAKVGDDDLKPYCGQRRHLLAPQTSVTITDEKRPARGRMSH